MLIPRKKRSLSDIAEIDQETIEQIAAQVPGGLTIDQIKADSDIADSISKKHASGSDNQDLSNLVEKVTGKGLSSNDYTTTDKDKLTATPIIIISETEPQNPQINNIWIDIS
jgi:hypothetical protein